MYPIEAQISELSSMGSAGIGLILLGVGLQLARSAQRRLQEGGRRH
jgi:hypothetical protein